MMIYGVYQGLSITLRVCDLRVESERVVCDLQVESERVVGPK